MQQIATASQASPLLHSHVSRLLLHPLLALSYGLGILHLGGNGWNLLGLITLIGAIALWYLPEMFLGRYRKGRADNDNAH
jgi:hypothetical protein